MRQELFPTVSGVRPEARPLGEGAAAEARGCPPERRHEICPSGNAGGREYFEAALPIIEDVIRFHAFRGRLGVEEREDFQSWAIYKLIENDYSRIRKFEGRSSLRSFLSVTIGHLLLDYWASKGGRRRPSSAAQLFAPDGIWLERYLADGFTVREAIQLVKANHESRLSDDELYHITVQLPIRTQRPKPAADSPVGEIASDAPSPERILEGKHREQARARLEAALEKALGQLPAEERVFVRMRFEEGSRINEIGRAFHIPDKSFYRRFQRTLRCLRSSLEKAGIDADCLALYRSPEDRANFRFRTV